jgi:hypothetical protein
MSWKSLSKDAGKDEKLRAYFGSLKNDTTLGAQIARRYMLASREVGQALLKSGVAASPEDVNNVLTLGFFHIYGPINDHL